MTTRPQLTSQDLVPNDQPYGARQETLAGLQQAGLPTSSEGVGGPAVAAQQPAPQPVPSPPAAGLPANFDVFQGRTPPETPYASPPAAQDVFRARAEQSPNGVLRDILTILPKYMEG